MSRSLEQILRLRALIEEESRLRLEKLALEAHRVDRAQEERKQLSSACRSAAFAVVEGWQSRESDSADQETWRVAVKDGALASSHQQRLQILAAAARQRVETGREEMLRLRQDKQRVEILLQNEAALEKIEMERSWQRVLDDWYAAAFYRRMRRPRSC
jgi:hypothetical protein